MSPNPNFMRIVGSIYPKGLNNYPIILYIYFYNNLKTDAGLLKHEFDVWERLLFWEPFLCWFLTLTLTLTLT